MQKPPDSSGKSANRFSVDYWKGRIVRPRYKRETNDGYQQVAQWYAQILHDGVRKAVPLGSNSREAAARQAARFYQKLKQEGWDAALRSIRPDAQDRQARELTIGAYLARVDELAPLPPQTFRNYAYALRRIAADICDAKMRKGSRFDPRGALRDLRDRLPLAALTPQAVDLWRLGFIRKQKDPRDVRKEQRAVRSANSFLRNARGLFSRRVLKAMRTHGVELPDPLPFTGVELSEEGSTRYRSTIDAGELLQAARVELAKGDPDAYAVILLALGAGLRRSEIDGLQWQNVIAAKGVIRVMTTAQKEAKTDESEGDVFVDPGLITELERTRRPGRTLFVVQPNTEHPQTKAAQCYRALETFRRVTDWLRAHGVMGDKPLHTLRKEFGSVVASSGDIFQAQRQLRHAQISTTEQYYADARTRATLPVGELLGGAKRQEGSK